MSARWISTSTWSPWSGWQAMPIEPPISSVSPSTTNGSRSALCSTSATATASSAPMTSGSRIAELVAAEAGDGVGGAQRRLEPLGDLLEQHVAVVVAERVVDLLEVVEVHDHHREAAVAALGGAQRLLDAVAEQHAVGQAGERVVQRLVLLGDRLAAAAVDGQQRQEQQRQDGEREVGGDHEHGREPEQQAGGRRLQEEVGREVAQEADLLRERDGAGDEARVERVEDERGGDDARQVGRLDAGRVGQAREVAERGSTKPAAATVMTYCAALNAMRSGGLRRIPSARIVPSANAMAAGAGP